MLCFPRLNPSASSSRLHLLRMGKRVEYECRLKTSLECVLGIAWDLLAKLQTELEGVIELEEVVHSIHRSSLLQKTDR